MAECKLTVHPEKTKIVYCKDRNRRGVYERITFDFLGFTFGPRTARGKNGKLFVAFTKKVMHLSCEAFIKKFILHILPKGFRKIRYFGFMGNRNRSMSFARVRRLIEVSGTSCRTEPDTPSSEQKSPEQATGLDGNTTGFTGSRCPLCGLPLRLHHEIGIQASGLPVTACMPGRIPWT